MRGGPGEGGEGAGAGRRPGADEHGAYYARYVARVPEGDVLAHLETLGREIVATLRAVPPERETYAYGPDKWSVRELAGHLVDTERVFQYRAAHVARMDPAPLPGMDQEPWAAASNAGDRPLRELADELEATRRSTVALLRGLPAAAWDHRGVASDVEVTVRALAYIICGHAEHHRAVLAERYGIGGDASGAGSGGEEGSTGSVEHRIPRRRDRGRDEAWIRAYLAAAPLGFLAVPDGDGPPHVNSNLFVHDAERGCVYLHTARVGRLRELLDRSPAVTFTAATMGRLLPADEALEFSVEYASVVVTGRATVVDDPEEQHRALQALLDRYAPHLEAGRDYRPPVPEELKRTAVYRVDVETWSGKQKAVEPDFPGAFRVPEPEIPFGGGPDADPAGP